MTKISWDDYLRAFVKEYRNEFNKLDEDARLSVSQNRKWITFLEPCQIDFFHFVDENSRVWIVTHDASRPDMQISVHGEVTLDALESEEFAFLKRNEVTALRELVYEPPAYQENCIGDTLWIQFRTGFIWEQRIDLRDFNVEKVVSDVITADLRRWLSNAQLEKIKGTVADLERDAEAIPTGVELRKKIIEATQRLKEEIQPLSERQREMREDIIGLRKLVGTKSFGEWKILLTDIDRLNGRIDALFDIKNAYDKMLEQQSEVMKQQTSFITWIKYAAILVPIAVISVPVIDAVLRYFLGLS